MGFSFFLVFVVWLTWRAGEKNLGGQTREKRQSEMRRRRMTQSGVADRCAELTGVLWWEEMRSVKSVEVWEERNAQQEGRWKCHGGQIQPVPSITHIPSALALVCHFVSISLLVHKRFLRLKTIFKKYSVQVFRWLAYFTLFMCVYVQSSPTGCICASVHHSSGF